MDRIFQMGFVVWIVSVERSAIWKRNLGRNIQNKTFWFCVGYSFEKILNLEVVDFWNVIVDKQFISKEREVQLRELLRIVFCMYDLDVKKL